MEARPGAKQFGVLVQVVVEGSCDAGAGGHAVWGAGAGAVLGWFWCRYCQTLAVGAFLRVWRGRIFAALGCCLGQEALDEILPLCHLSTCAAHKNGAKRNT